MKRINSAKLFLGLIFVFLSVISPSAAFGESEEISIQDIINRWAAIEQRLIESGTDYRLLDDVDVFRGAIQSYLNSEMYRIYRFAPLSSGMRGVFGPSTPNEMPELKAAEDLSGAFSEAVTNGDWEEAVLISTYISGNLLRALIRSGEVIRFSGIAYFRLLLLFMVFIALTAFVIWFLYKALARSSRRETEGAVFTRAIILAQEDERARLSRELHDSVTQELRYLSLEMNRIGTTEEKPLREKLCAEASSMQSALIRKVTDICDYLVPPDFRFQGLPDALRRLCLDFGKRTGIDCRIDIAENNKTDFLNEERQLQIFRIVQEALTNVEKHAEAKEAIVILRSDADGNIAAGVSDDGKGFVSLHEKELYSGGHLGIRGMRERAALLGGNLEIRSVLGEGTLVRLQVPAKGSFNGSNAD